MKPPPTRTTLFPYTTLFPTHTLKVGGTYQRKQLNSTQWGAPNGNYAFTGVYSSLPPVGTPSRQAAIADTLLGTKVCLRSEEHTSELQSRSDIVCRLLLDKIT